MKCGRNVIQIYIITQNVLTPSLGDISMAGGPSGAAAASQARGSIVRVVRHPQNRTGSWHHRHGLPFAWICSLGVGPQGTGVFC